MHTHVCFLYTLNIPGRIYKEPASVLCPQGRGGCWDEREASFQIFLVFNFLNQNIFTWLTVQKGTEGYTMKETYLVLYIA